MLPIVTSIALITTPCEAADQSELQPNVPAARILATKRLPPPIPPHAALLIVKRRYLSTFKDHLVKNHLIAAYAMLNSGNLPLDITDGDGKTALHYAAAYGDESLIMTMLLIAEEEDPKDKEGNTLLHEAALNKNIKTAKFLIENGADYNINNKDGLTPIELAFRQDFEFGKQLLKMVSSDRPLNFEGNIQYYYAGLNEQQKKEMNEIAPFEQILNRKFLAHTWGIKGHFTKGNIKASYEGYCPDPLRVKTFAKMDQFYNEQYRESLFESLKPRFSQANDDVSLDSEALAKKIIRNEEYVILPISGKTHVAYVVFSGNYVYRCNRGEQASQPGIEMFSFLPMEDREKALIAFIDKTRLLAGSDEIWSYFYGVNDLSLTPYYKDLTSSMIMQKWQTVGNCPLASLKSAILAICYDYSCCKGFSEENETAYLRFYKDFTRWLRADSLYEYLKGGDLDKELVSAILDKLKSKKHLQTLFPSKPKDIDQQKFTLADMRKGLTDLCVRALEQTT